MRTHGADGLHKSPCSTHTHTHTPDRVQLSLLPGPAATATLLLRPYGSSLTPTPASSTRHQTQRTGRSPGRTNHGPSSPCATSTW